MSRAIVEQNAAVQDLLKKASAIQTAFWFKNSKWKHLFDEISKCTIEDTLTILSTKIESSDVNIGEMIATDAEFPIEKYLALLHKLLDDHPENAEIIYNLLYQHDCSLG